jgi:hypothetical protein
MKAREIVARYEHWVENALDDPRGDREKISLHVPAEDLDVLVRLAAYGLHTWERVQYEKQNNQK